MEIAISQRSHITRRLSYGVIDAGVLAKHIILAYNSRQKKLHKDRLLSSDTHTHGIVLTQYGHDDIVFDNFNGASGNKVERDEDVSLVDQGVTRRRVRRFEFHGQSSETAR